MCRAVLVRFLKPGVVATARRFRCSGGLEALLCQRQRLDFNHLAGEGTPALPRIRRDYAAGRSRLSCDELIVWFGGKARWSYVMRLRGDIEMDSTAAPLGVKD